MFSLDIILDTPVVVLPRSSCSSQVLVAHLGQITVTNKRREPMNSNCDLEEDSIFNEFLCQRKDSTKSESTADQSIDDIYVIDIRNMNMYSLDTSTRKGFKLSALPRAEVFYSCLEDAIPVLHDTAIHLEITKILEHFSDAYDDLIGSSELKNILQVFFLFLLLSRAHVCFDLIFFGHFFCQHLVSTLFMRFRIDFY